MTAAPTRVVIFDRDEIDLIAAFAGCSLDESPGSNWVQDVGGLPEYICRVARAIKRSGKTTSQAIAIAVERMKVWATGKGVNADTQAKAAAALAEWEAKRAKSHAKSAAKKAAMTNALAGNILCLANVDYNVDIVRTAFENRTRQARRDWRAINPTASYEDGPPSWWCRELWTNFLIVSADYGPEASLYKIPYEVDEQLDVTFGEPIEVKTQYVVVNDTDLSADVPEADLQKLLAAASTRATPSERFLHLGTRTEPTSLDKVLALAATKATGRAAAKPSNMIDGMDTGPSETSPEEMIKAGKTMMAHGQSLVHDGKHADGKTMMMHGADMIAKARTLMDKATKSGG